MYIVHSGCRAYAERTVITKMGLTSISATLLGINYYRPYNREGSSKCRTHRLCWLNLWESSLGGLHHTLAPGKSKDRKETRDKNYQIYEVMTLFIAHCAQDIMRGNWSRAHTAGSGGTFPKDRFSIFFSLDIKISLSFSVRTKLDTCITFGHSK